MSAERRRGLPKSTRGQKAVKPARAVRKAGGKRPGRARRLVRTLGLLFAGWVVLVCVWSAGFVGVKCYSSAPASRPPAVPPPDGITGYVRAEAFTYLTLPEWFIVYSTDEHAGFIATRRPSDFPYLRLDPPVLGLLFDRLRRDETHASVRNGLPRDARRDRRQLHDRELSEVRL